jgi:hypothetical protein
VVAISRSDSSSESDGRAAVLVGRKRECAQIDALIGRASRGESGSVVLRAEVGMGKTALLRYAATKATGMTKLAASGVEAEPDLDFAGLHALVRPILEAFRGCPSRTEWRWRALLVSGRRRALTGSWCQRASCPYLRRRRRSVRSCA